MDIIQIFNPRLIKRSVSKVASKCGIKTFQRLFFGIIDIVQGLHKQVYIYIYIYILLLGDIMYVQMYVNMLYQIK